MIWDERMRVLRQVEMWDGETVSEEGRVVTRELVFNLWQKR